MFDSLIFDASRRYGVPESWIRAVIDTESDWIEGAYRHTSETDRSWGLMQLTLPTARGLGWTGTDTNELFQPALNIDLGTKLLGQLRRSYGDDFRRVYSAYNSGRPDLWKTSSEVAAHVAAAVENLSRYVQEAAQTFVEGGGNGPLVALIVFVVLWKWAGKTAR